MALGPIKDGCVRLTLDENIEGCLGIGEGIESTLSLQCLPEFGMSPVWACLNAKGVEDFPALPGIECLWIAVDNEAAGINAAHASKTRWLEAGREVFRIRSDKENNDLN